MSRRFDLDEMRPIEIDVALPWRNRHEPYLALNVSRWGSECFMGQHRPIIHVLVMWGRRFTERGGHRSFQLRGRWRD